MSDMLTHWAAYEDCRRLAQLDKRIEPEFRTAMEVRRDIGRLGTLTRLGAKWMQPMLSSVREHWREGDGDQQRNLAYVMGGLVHQATDNVMKPALSKASGGNWTQMQAYLRGTPGTPSVSREIIDAAHEYSAYLDAEIFREVYLGGGEEPFSKFFMAKLTPEGKEVEEFVRALFQRSLLSVHTLNPTVDDMQGWLDNLFRTVQPHFVGIDRWVRVFNEPDERKIAAYRVRSEFYNRDDPTILAARALHKGKPVSESLRRQVLDEGKYTCLYAQILQTGLDYVRRAGDFWRGETEHLIAPNFDQWPVT